MCIYECFVFPYISLFVSFLFKIMNKCIKYELNLSINGLFIYFICSENSDRKEQNRFGLNAALKSSEKYLTADSSTWIVEFQPPMRALH